MVRFTNVFCRDLMFFSAILLSSGMMLTSHCGNVLAQQVDFSFEGQVQNGVPAPWQLHVHRRGRGAAATFPQDPNRGKVVRLVADRSSFFLHDRTRPVDPAQHPWLSWAWKVDQHPNGGDVRARSDQAAQVLIVFDEKTWIRQHTISYIWDSQAPVNQWFDDNTVVARVRALVLDSGNANLGDWREHRRNIVNDYKAAFDAQQVPKVLGVIVQCNANNTNSRAEAFVTSLRFAANPPAGD